MKATTATSLMILLSHFVAHPAMAQGIKNLVSDETLAAYCSTVPLDSETTATLPGLDGTDVTGTVHCEAEDLVAGGDDNPGDDDDSVDQGLGNDDDQGDDDDGQDDGEDDNTGSGDGDDSDDDNSGSGGDDDSGDDDSGSDSEADEDNSGSD